MSAETTQITDISAANEKKAQAKRPDPSVNPSAQRKARSGPEVVQDTGSWPNVDVVKFFDEGRERMRDAFEQATGRFEHIKSAARDTSEVLQDCHTATISGLKELNEHALESIQSDVDRLFDYGRHLAEVKTVSDVLEAHGTFVRESFETGIERARAISEMSANLFKATIEPLQSGMANVFAQARKRAE